MNTIQYKIHGKERRTLKKELSKLKFYVKNFYYNRQLEKDMCYIYGLNEDETLISDEDALKIYNDAKLKIEIIQEKLSEINK